MDDEETVRHIVQTCTACWFRNILSFGDAHVNVERVSDPLIPEFLRATLDTFWGARIDFVHAQSGATPNTYADLSEHFRAHVFSARRCDGRFGLPNAVLTSESVCVSVG